MNTDKSLLEFLTARDTVDFIVRKSEYFDNFVRNNSEIVKLLSLGGIYDLAYVDRKNLDLVIEALGSSYFSAIPFVLGLMDRQNLEAAGIIQVQEQPFLDLRGQGVLMGFVDTGIDYTLDTFRYEDGTSKILYLFDQTGSGPPPGNGFIIGSEYTNEQINEALRSSDPYSVVPQRDTVGHGTFLASIAAGRQVNDFIGAAPDAELIVVKVREARLYYREKYLIPPEQKNAYESSSVMVGVEYILKKAQELGRPVSICMGLGTNLGSHDGFSLFEQYLSSVGAINGVCMTLAAGNESQARHHTQGVLTRAGESQNIEIQVGDNAGDIYVSIWNVASDRFSVSIKSPTGEIVGRVPAKTGTVLQSRLVLEKSIVIVEYYFPVEGSGGQSTTVKILNATPGIWTITVYGDIVLDGTYHAWLPITGFVSPEVEFLTPNPYYTIVVPGTAIGPITVGAYNGTSNSLYAKTSWGPTRLPDMAPDFVAPGVNVGGFYPTGYGSMDGTSASAAITAGAGALMLQWGIVERNDPSLSTYQIRAYLIRGCDRISTIAYPNSQWGYGSLNLQRSFNLMRELT